MLFCLIFSTFLFVLKLQKTDCQAHGSVWKSVWFNFMFEQPIKGCLKVSPMVTNKQEKIFVIFIFKRQGECCVYKLFYLLFYN